MAQGFTQDNVMVKLTTPLGKDALLALSFTGREALSELFYFQVVANGDSRKPPAFDKLLVQSVTVEIEMPGKLKRYFNGIVRRVSEARPGNDFTEYTLDIVPTVWALTRNVRSRHFQHLSVPDILKKVFAGFEVKYELSGTFMKRRYVAQYRESDFAFASRLMEEEGIYYYFLHANGSHKMVVSNASSSHVDVPFQPKVEFDSNVGGKKADLRISDWVKSQEIRSGKYSMWDHCFEIPQQTLEASKTIQETVTVGTVSHKLKVGNAAWEIYEYPGGFAEHFDGISPSGSSQAGELQNLFKDNERIAKIRMEQEALPSILIQGASNCNQFSAGHKFELKEHPNGNGAYVLTSVDHTAVNPMDYTSGGREGEYSNRFSCIPMELPYRPPQVTPKPQVQGVQLAFVVGPPGEKIFCDKYGRVKVQFHWDREGKEDADSSCWLRVSNNWGGAGWGGNFVPHVGQEVIVAYEEGDPDKPIIVGRVYNAEQMPPLGLPGNKTKSVLRDQGDNMIMMEGNKGDQQIVMFSPKTSTILCMGAKPPASIPGADDRGAGSGAGAGNQTAVSFVTPHDFSNKLTAENIAHSEEKVNIPTYMPIELGSGSGSGTPTATPTAPVPEGLVEGFNAITGGFWQILVGKDAHWEVKGSTHDKIVGNKFTTILGFKTDVIHGYERKHVQGFTHATTVGWKAEYIGGYKTEVITGRVQQLLGGTKLEVIKGSTTKLHSGREYKHDKNGKADKHAGVIRMMKDLKQQKKSEKLIVDTAKHNKIGGDLKTQASTIDEKAKKMKLKAEATLQQEASTLLGKWNLRKEKVKAQAKLDAAEALIKAADITLKGPCKLG